jgi:hypothetical protein
MTPEMGASAVTLGRRSTVVSRLLDITTWGRRNRLNGTDDDPVEREYEGCYAFEGPAIAREMKARRREKLSMDALEDLVVHLGGLRDERKAVFAVTEGWLQFRPNPALARPLTKTDPGQLLLPPPVVDRGTPRARGASQVGAVDLQKCEAERLALANMDNTDRLQLIGEGANRVNVTFYPIGVRL